MLVHERSPIAGVQAYPALPVHVLMAAPPVMIVGAVIVAMVSTVGMMIDPAAIIVATTPIDLADDPGRLARRSKFA